MNLAIIIGLTSVILVLLLGQSRIFYSMARDGCWEFAGNATCRWELALLGGGLVPGTNTLLSGPSGIGKTTTAMRCMLAALERGEKGTYYLFDEGLATLLNSECCGRDGRTTVHRKRVAQSPASGSGGTLRWRVC